MITRLKYILLVLPLLTCFCSLATPALAASEPPPPINPPTNEPTPDPFCSDGVLINLTKQTRQNYSLNDKTCVKDLGFVTYSKIFIDQLIPLLLFAALILIIWSGVQYMTSGISTENQKAAKARIIGIVIGVIFFILGRLILNTITPSINKSIEENASRSTSHLT